MIKMTLTGRDRLKLGASLLLGAAGLALFLVTRSETPQTAEIPPQQYGQIAARIDREVDSIFALFRLQSRAVSKRRVEIPNSGLFRTERRVLIPDSILPVQVNLELNRMARRYNCKAVASENLKENTVTVHIEVGPYILHSIVLKPAPAAPPKAGRTKQTKT